MLAGGACSLADMAFGQANPSSGKKGFCVALRTNPAWQENLLKLNAKWFYTWGAKTPEPLPAGTEFVPMIWGKWSCTQDMVGDLAKRGYKTLLGFNEPGQYKQSNLSVEEALQLWPILMESGMRLGSPACVHADGEWMTAFMRAAEKRGYRIDFIAMHAYMGDNVKHFLERIDHIYKLYKKPVWLTEFCVADWDACADRPNIYTEDAVLKFMEAVLPELAKRDYLERYAWYSSPYYYHPLNTSVLFNSDDTLTRLGRLYASV